MLRLAWAVIATRQPVGLHDPAVYQLLARSLADGNGYVLPVNGEPTAYFPLGYPALLAAAMRVGDLFGSPAPEVVASALNLVLGTLAILLTGLLGRRVVGPAVGALAAWGVALFPSLVLHTALTLSETAFIAAVLGGLVAACWDPWRPRLPRWPRLVAAGGLLGLATLIRPTILPGLLLIVVALIWSIGWRRALRVGVVALVAFLVVVEPWVIRNGITMDRWTLSTNTGDNLCIGNHPDATGAFGLPAVCNDIDILEPGGEARQDRVLTERSLQWIRDDPLRQVGLVVARTRYTLAHDHDALEAVESYGDDPWLGSAKRPLEVLANLWFFSALALAVASVPRLLTRDDPRRPLLVAVMLGVVVATWPFFGDARFHVPMNPLLTIPAAMSVLWIAEKLRGRTRRGEVEIPAGERSTAD